MTNPLEQAASLAPRYEIRQLTLEHIHWVKAIIAHGMLFRSSFFGAIYPTEKTGRVYRTFAATDNLIRPQLEEGLSYGVFDTEYEFKRPESAVTEGKLYWNSNDTSATGEDLLEAMDFPLVSIALSVDAVPGLGPAQLAPTFGVLPALADITRALDSLDDRDPTTLKPKDSHELLFRSGTVTRADYEGRGIMKNLAHWLMAKAGTQGFKRIQIDCIHDAVTKAWLNPPAPFISKLLGAIDNVGEFEEVVDGEVRRPFAPSQERATRILVTLYEEQSSNK
ncbi:hypothetical protein NKR23_g312 [Pleurostoma richardsiae]|uniref:Uncharacterized protein n=1 Tax=Pleurostoma richardsiae TaxID=41990 RepID=A0AA38RT74_9PEZI|nr:hypothetical protein NKR23_g312 [Pleurostoma richardsiae]